MASRRGKTAGRGGRRGARAKGPELPPGLEIWQVLTWRPSEFHGVAWSPDGRWIAAAAGDGCVWLFDLSTGERRLLEGHTGPVPGVRPEVPAVPSR